MSNESSTEQKILEAAEEVFMEEGFAGARMQHIADRAGINKAMLHYYFRTKDKLFELVFAHKMKQFVPKVQTAIQDPALSIFEKLDQFVTAYLDMLRRNPRLPIFILSTMNRNPELMKSVNVRFGQLVIDNLEQEMAKGNIRQVNAHQFMLSVVGMCIFPFVGRPIFSEIFGLDKKAYDQILAERHEHVSLFIRSMLKAD